MIWKAKEIPRFVQSCIKAEEICRSYQEAERKTTGLMKDTYLLFVLTTTAQVTGNVLYHTSTGKQIASFEQPRLLIGIYNFLFGYSQLVHLTVAQWWSTSQFTMGTSGLWKTMNTVASSTCLM